MKTITKTLLVVLTLASAACTRPDRFDNGAGTGDGAGSTAPATAPLTGASNPASPEYFSQTIGDRVLFAVDSAALTPAGQATLNGQATWLMTNADYQAIIEGHADEQGTREYNVALGARRANAVREYLVSKGVPTSRMRTISYGKERPVELCADESCYSKNRRAVTIISSSGLS